MFLIYKDGRLLRHTTQRLKADMDEEIFSGMLTAVQTFIKDSLGKEEKAELGSMEYGGRKILLEKSKHVVSAAVISGEEPKDFRGEMKTIVNNVEGEYDAILSIWDGDLSKLADTGKFLTQLGAYKPIEIEEERIKIDVRIMSELELYQGFVGLKIAIKNKTQTIIADAVFKLVYKKEALRLDRWR